MQITKYGSVLWLAFMTLPVAAADLSVSIRSDFPGGNVIVVKNERSTVHVSPDLRGGKPWFYWNFEATASQPGRVTFAFPSTQKIGVRGPAFSVDEGKSWRWLGADHTEFASPGNDAKTQQESFFYDFTPEHLKVRFAVAIPYLQQDLETFLRTNAANSHLKQHALAKTRNGTSVELLQIGEPGPNVKPFLVTARHHACESMASYILEGFLQEAISNSTAGVEFRKRHVLFAVPLVDKDGVQAGDQGKNRSPHDHNRDYGESPIYPEIKAIQDLAEGQDIHYSLDFHCPFLRGDIHEAFHFLGLGLPHIKDNVNEFIAWIKEERPPAVMAPLNLLADSTKPNAANPRINSHYFAMRNHSIFAATLEIPYTQSNPPLDAAMARQYGRSMLKAWNRADFVSAAPDSTRGSAGHANLVAFRSAFQKIHRSTPQEAEAMARVYLDDAKAAALYRVEANILMAQLRLFQRRFEDALPYCDAARNDTHATTQQISTAALQRLQSVAGKANSTSEHVEAQLKEVLHLPYPANDQQAKAFDVACVFHQSRKNYERAIECARHQFTFAVTYEKGKILNRIASLYELLDKPKEAIDARQEAVQLLRTRLGAKPERSVFGAMMVADLFDALCGIPTATVEEKRLAANLVLDHDIVTAQVKEKVRKSLAEFDKE